MIIAVSACLLGEPCRYDGSSRPNDSVQALCEQNEIVPICPECIGGLLTPRLPNEIVCGAKPSGNGTSGEKGAGSPNGGMAADDTSSGSGSLAKNEIRVVDSAGIDNTAAFMAGALAALEQAQRTGCCAAVLKSKSPSCGSGLIYDGTFTGTLTDGWGVAARLLRDAGITVVDENHLKDLPSD